VAGWAGTVKADWEVEERAAATEALVLAAKAAAGWEVAAGWEAVGWVEAQGAAAAAEAAAGSVAAMVVAREGWGWEAAGGRLRSQARQTTAASRGTE